MVSAPIGRMTPASQHKSATKLVLEDGTELNGEPFGASTAVGGEVVFNTAMTGYVETLTDPSYRGQILVLTYPLVGNYGVPAPRTRAPVGPYESDSIQVQGLAVQSYVNTYSHASATRSLSEWLETEGVPGITGIDTRVLTERLREVGTMRGWIVPDGMTAEQVKQSGHQVDMKNVFDLVTPREMSTHGAGSLKVLLIDAGAKDAIVRSLLARGVSVTRVSWRSELRALAEHADGVVIANGPGNPKDAAPLIGQIAELIGWYRKPVFGICLGHQILALAAGADTYKLKYGHRSVNQPVQDLITRRCFVTSQNHGYAVNDESIGEDWAPWFVNLNDGTNEGLRSLTQPFYSVQFHPEASPGPRDTGFLFDDFIRHIAVYKQEQATP